MTKQFCDICGEPGSDRFIETKHILKDREWSGTKTGQGSCCDGRWTPTFNIHAVIRVENLSKDDYREKPPDLCKNCVRMLLQNLIASIK